MDGRKLLLTYYGDDFTGSTDVMEALEWGGVRTMLFLEPPTPQFLTEKFPDVSAVGVAGVSRSMSVAEMEVALPPVFESLKQLGAPAFHYKVCSTFDSSPTVGSIGRATEISLEVFGEQLVPLLVGAPYLHRYVAFSNLFARVDDTTYRLDRHPTMSKHPVTPMNEADLRLHLGQQTSRRIGAMNLLHLAQPPEKITAALKSLHDEGTEIMVFDTLDDNHLLTIGRLLDLLIAESEHDRQRVMVGSSGVEKALVLYWQAIGKVKQAPPPPSVGAVDQLIVVSGSAAPGTAAQIDWAEAQGFKIVRLDAPLLVDPVHADGERSRSVECALDVLRTGASVILFSAHGPDDANISATKARLINLGLNPLSVSSRLGTQQGLILRELLERTGLRRAVVAGGDTCGYAARQLGIYALSAVAPIFPGAPLCRAHSSESQFDGMQIALKGGQSGLASYFGQIRQGGMG